MPARVVAGARRYAGVRHDPAGEFPGAGSTRRRTAESGAHVRRRPVSTYGGLWRPGTAETGVHVRRAGWSPGRGGMRASGTTRPGRPQAPGRRDGVRRSPAPMYGGVRRLRTAGFGARVRRRLAAAYGGIRRPRAAGQGGRRVRVLRLRARTGRPPGRSQAPVRREGVRRSPAPVYGGVRRLRRAGFGARVRRRPAAAYGGIRRSRAAGQGGRRVRGLRLRARTGARRGVLRRRVGEAVYGEVRRPGTAEFGGRVRRGGHHARGLGGCRVREWGERLVRGWQVGGRARVRRAVRVGLEWSRNGGRPCVAGGASPWTGGGRSAVGGGWVACRTRVLPYKSRVGCRTRREREAVRWRAREGRAAGEGGPPRVGSVGGGAGEAGGPLAEGGPRAPAVVRRRLVAVEDAASLRSEGEDFQAAVGVARDRG